jgi:flagellar motor switch protein FliN/FliY
MLPKAELQTLLPAARGAADLPDMEALSRVLRDLAGQLTAQLAQEFSPPVQLSLPEASAAPHDPNQPVLRVEHQMAAGHPGAETTLTVVHLVPVAALETIARSVSGTGPSTTSEQQTPTSGAAGGGATDMENHMASTQPATSVHGVQFQPFDGEAEAGSGTNLDLLLDVSLRVSVELGRTELAIKEVLALGPGSVVELDKLAGEPVDILVNNRLIAKGEVVVVDENFGVRVTDIISPQKLIGKLR